MIMRAEHRADFLSIQNDAARDERLSLAARGLLLYILSMADDWQFSINGLAKQLGIGRNQVVNLTKELQAAGYISIKRETAKGGKFSGAEWIIREKPENHSPENRSTDNGTTDEKTTVPKTTVPKTIIRKSGPIRKTISKNNHYIEGPSTKGDTRTHARGLHNAQIVGKYQNVFLSEDECAELTSLYDIATVTRYINRLSEYLEQHPDKNYANHKATIEKWIHEDEAQTV